MFEDAHRRSPVLTTANGEAIDIMTGQELGSTRFELDALTGMAFKVSA